MGNCLSERLSKYGHHHHRRPGDRIPGQCEIHCALDTNDRFHLLEEDICPASKRHKATMFSFRRTADSRLKRFADGVAFQSHTENMWNHFFLRAEASGLYFGDQLLFSLEELQLFSCRAVVSSKDGDDDEDVGNAKPSSWATCGCAHCRDRRQRGKNQCWESVHPLCLWMSVSLHSLSWDGENKPENPLDSNSNPLLITVDGLPLLQVPNSQGDPVRLARAGGCIFLAVPWDEYVRVGWERWGIVPSEVAGASPSFRWSHGACSVCRENRRLKIPLRINPRHSHSTGELCWKCGTLVCLRCGSEFFRSEMKHHPSVIMNHTCFAEEPKSQQPVSDENLWRDGWKKWILPSWRNAS